MSKKREVPIATSEPSPVKESAVPATKEPEKPVDPHVAVLARIAANR